MRILTFTKVIVDWARISRGKFTVCGAFVKIYWTDEKNTLLNYYVSLSPEPSEDTIVDDYGYLDDEIFYYLAGIKELLRTVLFGNPDGWRIKRVSLNSANRK